LSLPRGFQTDPLPTAGGGENSGKPLWPQFGVKPQALDVCLIPASEASARAIEGEIDRIRSVGLEEMRREWRRLYRSEPPRISRDLLVLALGYRLHEIEHGGLGKSTRRKLQTMAKALRTTGRVGPTPSLSLKSGARLVREWRGRTHTVTITEDGFEYAGTSYPSLTKKIAPTPTRY
jgi:hypothetical protein